MKEKRDRKTYMLAAAVLAVLLAAGGLVAVLLRGHLSSDHNPNLALKKGVKATCDSVEQESLSAQMAIDGNDGDRASRWSSENNREDASHFIRLEFPEEISVSFVVLKWERANVISYALEGSADGTAFETLASFDTATETLTQEIVLDEPVSLRFLRLSTYAVSKEEADFSDLYQNVSLYEFEVYADKPTAYKLKAPVIERPADGGRRLVLPETPDGFRVTLVGADLEQVIGADGTVYDNIQDKDVTVGYRVEDERGREETREVSFVVKVPAADAHFEADDALSGMDDAVAESGQYDAGNAQTDSEINESPYWVIPSIAEWRGGRGIFNLASEERVRIIVDTNSRPPEKETENLAGTGSDAGTADAQALLDVAALLGRQCENSRFRWQADVREGTLEDAGPGDIYLGYADKANGLGEEGYTCDITDKCVIKAENAVGIRWGTVTLLQMICRWPNLPQGHIRDYPLYEVRGFGIDVARKAVSLDTLYRMMENMSWYKMNDLTIHLNDNEILATSGLTGSTKQAMTAESAFRLESDVLGVAAGEKAVSPQEYVYTKEEFAQFIATAKTYGVTVVPEIDTPAHSLAITKRYPEYALRASNESVDQIDLANDKAVTLMEEIWREALDDEKGAFRDAEIVHIGMDEYYGDGEQYRQYLNRINDLVQESGKTVRLWGSLSNMGGATMPSAENLQMNIWSTVWADPREMYEAGYSLINMQNNHLYIIPGGGYDRLDAEKLYKNWAPNKFYDYDRMETIPAYSPQMLGASYMIWNDMCGRLDLGICEHDLFLRFIGPLDTLSVKLWGASKLEEFAEKRRESGYDSLLDLDIGVMCMPRMYAGADTGEPGYSDLFAESEAAEPEYEIEMKVWLEPEDAAQGEAGQRQAQIIAEGDSAYGEWAFYAVEPETGKVGFTREGRTYTFDYTLPRGEWVNLKLFGGNGGTTLVAEGETPDSIGWDSIGSEQPFEEHAAFVFPLQRVGEQTGSFDGEAKVRVIYSSHGNRVYKRSDNFQAAADEDEIRLPFKVGCGIFDLNKKCGYPQKCCHRMF